MIQYRPRACWIQTTGPSLAAPTACASATALPRSRSPQPGGDDYVQRSLRLFMHLNAIFLCDRLYAQFPSEVALLSLLLNGASVADSVCLRLRVGVVCLGLDGAWDGDLSVESHSHLRISVRFSALL
jgi:hypothetical protein